MRLDEGDEVRLRALARIFRNLVRLNHPVAIPPEYRAIAAEQRTPFVRDAWRRMTAALTKFPPQPHITPRDETRDARAAANIGERWVSAAMEAMDKDSNQGSVVFEAVRALVRDGESVIKVVDRTDAWANFPLRSPEEEASAYLSRVANYERGAPIPFAWRVVDRLQMLFGDGEYGDDWALEYGEYARPYLVRQYGMVESSANGATTLVDPATRLGSRPKPEGLLATAAGRSVKIEFFSADYWHVVIDGSDAPGFPRENPYAPRIPYFRARADSDSESPLYSLLFLVPGLDALLTMKLNWSYLSAFPTPVIESVPNQLAPSLDLPTGEDGEETKLVWKPGKALDLPPGKTIRFMEPPAGGKDLNDLIGIQRSLIDIAGVDPAFRGGGPASSGYDTNQRTALQQMVLQQLATASKRQFEQACEFLFWLVQHRIKQPVYVLASGAEKDAKKYLAVSPGGDDDTVTSSKAPVDQMGPLEFTFRPVLPTDEQAQAMIAMQLTNGPKPLISKRYALERFLNIEDPEGMADEIAVETALDSPPLSDMVMENALREAGVAPLQPAGPPPGAPGPGGLPGGMLPPGPGQLEPTMPGDVPGQLAGGLPSVPGVNLPLGPPVAAGIPGNNGGRPPGAYPGQPPNQGPPLPPPLP